MATYWVMLFVIAALLADFEAEALSYDYTATAECLPLPHKPQYNGGIIQNPELREGLKGWSKFGNPNIELRKIDNNDFIVAHSRYQSNDVSHRRFTCRRITSIHSPVSEGIIPVRAIFKTSTGLKHAGIIPARSKCWSMIKGGLTADEFGQAELFFEADTISSEIWVDSVSLQPFTPEEWKSHQQESIEKTRKTRVRISVLDKQSKPIPNANITILQKKLSYPFGSSINKNILTNTAYQNWFSSRFWVTVFEDELKWYSTEYSQGKEDYSTADAMFQFTSQHSIAVRGQNVIWDDANYQPSWVPGLPSKQLYYAVTKRVNSVMRRYKGQVIGWDVVNENMHHSYFEKKLGREISGYIYRTAQDIDGSTNLFLNEFSTIEDSKDVKANPSKYIQKIKETQAYGGKPKNLGIGLESHFTNVDVAYMRSAIDMLGTQGLPMWLTEVDVGGASAAQAAQLEQILREGHSHPKINGIMMWATWRPQGCVCDKLHENNQIEEGRSRPITRSMTKGINGICP